MKLIKRSLRHALIFALVSMAQGSLLATAQQQSLATLRGTVADPLGGVIVGATVTVTDAGGVERSATTNEEGNYVFAALPPGRYTVRASAPGFASYEQADVGAAAGRTAPLNITMTVSIEQESVTVTAEPVVGTDPEANAGAVVLRGADLDALPDDPDDLAEALQALAGPSAGPGGGEVFVDGFTGGRLPPKESIREIRVNRNPFSAEYDRLGYGRVEIFTKPGTDKLRGQGFFNFSDARLDARSAFARRRAPFQSRRYGGNLSGPLRAHRASFFLDLERRETDEEDVVNAVTLDPNLVPTPLNQTVSAPQRRTTFSPRLDYQLNQTNTLVARYSYERGRRQNAGLGEFVLPSRAFNATSAQHTLQLTETAVINQRIINETRFQFIRDRTTQQGNATLPTVRVLEAFIGGGPQSGNAANTVNRFELSNYTSWTVGSHSLKAGARLRTVRINDVSPQNFAGTFTFAGGLAPQLDANSQPIVGSNGQFVLTSITSLERFRRTVLFQRQGLTSMEVRARGGGPTQFSISTGEPAARVTQSDFGPFMQDDWRLRPNVTLSLGLRYEAQSHTESSFNFAPRVAFAWSPGAGGASRQQRAVVRGGFGIFYERFGENLALQTNRYNGSNQQQFVVTDSTLLGQAIFTPEGNVTGAPTAAQLTALSPRVIVWRLAEDLRAPYTMQTAFSYERQLPRRVSLSVSYIGARTLHVLRARNVNAPIPGTGLRPVPTAGNIFQYESSGRFNQNQLIVSVNNRASRAFTLFATYTLNRAKSDTDYPGTFPANQYDLTNEYGPSSQDVRHRLFVGGSLNRLPWSIRLNPFVTANSGRPFNITIGRDINSDTLFTERPALATDLTKPGVVTTRFGAFDPNPQPGQPIIPRNYGRGPAFFSVNMRVSKVFSFGEATGRARGGAGGSRGGGGERGGGSGRRGGGGPFGGGGGGGDFGGGDARAEGRYNLTFSVNFQNLFNHTNAGQPVGNLSSPLFGQSVVPAGVFGIGGGGARAGARHIEAQVRFSF